MAVFVPWGWRRSSIFDLEHIGGLSANRTIPLLVSPQVLYALQNVALVEIADPNRYATELADGGYYRVQPGDEAEYALFLEIVSQTGLQLADGLSVSTPLNFKETIVGATLNTNASAGSNTLSLSPPSGEAWVVEAFAALNLNTVCTALIFTAGIIGGNDTWLDRIPTPPAAIYTTRRGPITLDENSEIRAVFEGCSAGDDLYFRVFGHSMEVLA